MIQLTDINGRLTYIAPGAVAAIEAVSLNRHGVQAEVRLVSGHTIEVRETASHVAAEVRATASLAEAHQSPPLPDQRGAPA